MLFKTRNGNDLMLLYIVFCINLEQVLLFNPPILVNFDFTAKLCHSQNKHEVCTCARTHANTVRE